MTVKKKTTKDQRIEEILSMSEEEKGSAYKEERKARGTQEYVAELLGVKRLAIIRREAGVNKISRSMLLALLAIPRRKN